MRNATRTLGEWLQELVSEEEARRHVAAKHVMPLREDAQQAVRDAVNAPDFPFDSWYAALQNRMREGEPMASEYRERDRERRKFAEERIRARYTDAVAKEQEPFQSLIDADEWVEPGPIAKKMHGRLHQVSWLKTRDSIAAERLTQQNLSLTMVFRSLRTETLRDPQRLRELLRDPRQAYRAEEILANLGTAAADLFADELLARVAVTGIRSSTTWKALQAMLAGDGPRIREIARWLTQENAQQRAIGARILRLLGTDVARFAPEVIPRLVALSRDGEMGKTGNGERVAALYALGSITQGTDTAVDWLLEQSESGEIWVKRASLVALGEIARQPERVVPRLIRALDDFTDPDPDSYYHGAHQVVTNGLKAFGSAAVAAVPALIDRISNGQGESIGTSGNRTKRYEIDPGVVSTLVAIGEPAVAALPRLEWYATQSCEESSQASGFVSLASAIKRLRNLTV